MNKPSSRRYDNTDTPVNAFFKLPKDFWQLSFRTKSLFVSVNWGNDFAIVANCVVCKHEPCVLYKCACVDVCVNCCKSVVVLNGETEPARDI
ncbi:hypothetical protein ScPMuIL_007005 [Solemya velum]